MLEDILSDPPLFWIGFGLMCVFWGACASVARGSGTGSGFIWGFLLGPFGVIVAAVKGVGDRIEALTSATNTARAATSRPAGSLRVRARHHATPAPDTEVAAITCPHCQQPVEPPAAPGTYACPHCKVGIVFE